MDYRRVRIYIVLHFNSLTGETQPRMPMNGPYWSQEKLDLFQKWMKGGYEP